MSAIGKNEIIRASGSFNQTVVPEESPTTELERVSSLALKKIPAVAFLPTEEPDLLAKLSMQINPAERVLSLFDNDALIIRAIDLNTVLEDLPDAVSLGGFGREIKTLKEGNSLRNISSTLIVKDQPVKMYHGGGLLINGNSSEVVHIYGTDSNSNTDDQGNFQGGGDPNLTFGTLKDLANAIRDTDLMRRFQMNEVNLNVNLNDILGLVVRTAQDPRQDAIINLKILCVKKRLKQKFKTELPVYKYNENDGSMQRLSDKIDFIQRMVHLGRLAGSHGNTECTLASEYLLQE